MESEEFLFCEKHGRVLGPHCRACLTIAYIEKVEAGKIVPEILVERPDQEDSHLLPMQIKFRAFQIKKETSKNPRKAYAWKNGRRVVRIFPTRHLKGLL